MITLQTITGLLIAATLLVQGTGQREVTKVEEEPVVKEEVETVQQNEHWFAVNPDGTIGAYLGQGTEGEESLPENCGQALEELCGIMLTDDDVTEIAEDEYTPNISNVLEDEDDIQGSYEIRHRPES